MTSFECYLDAECERNSAGDSRLYAAFTLLDTAELRHAEIVDYNLSHLSESEAVNELMFDDLQRAACALNGLRTCLLEGNETVVRAFSESSIQGSYLERMNESYVAALNIYNTHLLVK